MPATPSHNTQHIKYLSHLDPDPVLTIILEQFLYLVLSGDPLPPFFLQSHILDISVLVTFRGLKSQVIKLLN